MGAALETKAAENLSVKDDSASLERESLGAGTAGGAAIGAVVALAAVSGLAAGPLLGALVGAGLGAAGHLAISAANRK